MLEGYNQDKSDVNSLRKVRSGGDLHKVGLWKVNRTCRLRKFLMK